PMVAPTSVLENYGNINTVGNKGIFKNNLSARPKLSIVHCQLSIVTIVHCNNCPLKKRLLTTPQSHESVF
ncbi:MAG: hypothetical protein U0K87_05925, partial [Ruminococcus sp.]|nr:hypothetical protein [Ruminococcus sp.]